MNEVNNLKSPNQQFVRINVLMEELRKSKLNTNIISNKPKKIIKQSGNLKLNTQPSYFNDILN